MSAAVGLKVVNGRVEAAADWLVAQTPALARAREIAQAEAVIEQMRAMGRHAPAWAVERQYAAVMRLFKVYADLRSAGIEHESAAALFAPEFVAQFRGDYEYERAWRDADDRRRRALDAWRAKA